jgi:hypothetical protein
MTSTTTMTCQPTRKVGTRQPERWPVLDEGVVVERRRVAGCLGDHGDQPRSPDRRQTEDGMSPAIEP